MSGLGICYNYRSTMTCSSVIGVWPKWRRDPTGLQNEQVQFVCLHSQRISGRRNWFESSSQYSTCSGDCIRNVSAIVHESSAVSDSFALYYEMVLERACGKHFPMETQDNVAVAHCAWPVRYT